MTITCVLQYMKRGTLMFPSSYIVNCMLWSFNLLVVCGPLNCCMWNSSKKKLNQYQRRKLLFIIPGWDMPYFHLLIFVINEQYVEGEISLVVVFVYVFAFNFALTIFPLEFFPLTLILCVCVCVCVNRYPD